MKAVVTFFEVQASFVQLAKIDVEVQIFCDGDVRSFDVPNLDFSFRS